MDYVEINENDVVIFKKKHPCGSDCWKVIKTGIDIKIMCEGCGREITLQRKGFFKRFKEKCENMGFSDQVDKLNRYVKYYKWVKKIYYTKIVYESDNNIELHVSNNETTGEISCELFMVGQIYQLTQYDAKRLQKSIDRLKPEIISVVGYEHISNGENKEPRNFIKLISKYEIDEIRAFEIKNEIEKSCEYNDNGICRRHPRNCNLLYENCMYFDEYQMYLKYYGNLSEIKAIGIKDFVVKMNVFKCINSNHHIEDVNAIVNVIEKSGKRCFEEIKAGYCKECNVYFITNITYEKMRSKGIVLCRVTNEKNYKTIAGNYYNKMAEESILMQYGYNVSENDNLTSEQRHRILASLIEYEIMTRVEIVNYLNLFINQRRHVDSMKTAITKWKEDIEYIEKYNSGKHTKYVFLIGDRYT